MTALVLFCSTFVLVFALGIVAAMRAHPLLMRRKSKQEVR